MVQTNEMKVNPVDHKEESNPGKKHTVSSSDWGRLQIYIKLYGNTSLSPFYCLFL